MVRIPRKFHKERDLWTRRPIVRFAVFQSGTRSNNLQFERTLIGHSSFWQPLRHTPGNDRPVLQSGSAHAQDPGIFRRSRHEGQYQRPLRFRHSQGLSGYPRTTKSTKKVDGSLWRSLWGRKSRGYRCVSLTLYCPLFVLLIAKRHNTYVLFWIFFLSYVSKLSKTVNTYFLIFFFYFYSFVRL